MASSVAVYGTGGLVLLALGGLMFKASQQQDQIDLVTAAVERSESIRPAQVRELRSRVRRLEEEITTLRAQPMARITRHAPSAGAPESERAMVEEESPAPPPRRDIENAVLEVLESYDSGARDRLRAVIQEERETVREERRSVRREQFVQRTRESVEGLATRAHLSAHESELVITKLTEEHDAIRAAYRKAREDGSFREARETRNKVREQTDAEIEEVLDDEGQFKAYQAMREEESQRRRRGRRPR